MLNRLFETLLKLLWDNHIPTLSNLQFVSPCPHKVFDPDENQNEKKKDKLNFYVTNMVSRQFDVWPSFCLLDKTLENSLEVVKQVVKGYHQGSTDSFQAAMDEREKFAQKKLEECKNKPVLFTVKTSISYKGNIDDDAPISGKVHHCNFERFKSKKVSQLKYFRQWILSLMILFTFEKNLTMTGGSGELFHMTPTWGLFLLQ